MEIQKEKRSYGNIALVISLLAGAGAVLSYPYWGIRSGQRLVDALPANHYRIDCLWI